VVRFHVMLWFCHYKVVLFHFMLCFCHYKVVFFLLYAVLISL
jgi:hypothetical protein